MNPDRDRANRRTAWVLAVAALGMCGFGYALVPLYDVFCQITGLNGKTTTIAKQEAAALQVDSTRWITLELDANTNTALPWHFIPTARQVRLHPGELSEVTYIAENRSATTVTGRAIPSVAPGTASPFFRKIECFCFTEQTLAPGERREMPVRFIVEPDLPTSISLLTLSYTFYRVDDAVADSSRPAS